MKYNNLFFTSILFLTADLIASDSTRLIKPTWNAEAFSGISIGRQKNLLGTDATRIDSTEYNSTALYGSYGAGVIYGIRFNCFFMENIGFSLGYQHLKGKKQRYTELHDPLNNIHYIGKEFSTYDGVTADIIFRTSGNKKLQAMARLGVCFIPASNIHSDLNYIAPSSISLHREFTTTNRSGRGFSNSLGIDYKLNKHLRCGIELKSLLFNAIGSHRELNSYVIQGENKLDEQTTYARKINYVDEINSTSNIDSNPGYSINKPKDELAPAFNFSSFLGLIKVIWEF